MYCCKARRSEESPNRMSLERHSSFTDLTERSANEFKFGKENLILFPLKREGARDRKAAVRCRERLGGLLKYYEREPA